MLVRFAEDADALAAPFEAYRIADHRHFNSDGAEYVVPVVI